MLALSYDPTFGDIPVVFLPFALITRSIDPAGRSFESFYSAYAPKKASKAKKFTKQADDSAEEPTETRTDPKKAKQAKSTVSAFKLDRVLEGQDLYALLCLSESASEAQLKQSYRQLVLKAHPDKQTFSSEDAAEKAKQHFLRIQAAFEILSDSSKRRQYDCSRPFDESIPSAAELVAEGDFYRVFSAAFERNARWSNKLPVPQLGTPETDYKDVEKLYEFWFVFDSWRDFPNEAEHDLSQATCREEKRYMERENLRNQKKLVQDERARIMRLVETAQKLDPRVIRFRAEEQRKKDEEKRAKEAAKEAAEADKREAEEQAKRDKENDDKRNKLLEQERLDKLKSLKQKIKQKVVSDEVFAFVKNFSRVDELETLWLNLEKTQTTAQVADEMDKFKNKNTSNLVTAKKKVDVSSLDTSSWTPEELALFTKALNKYPVGVPKRWELVANLIGTRSLEEAVAMNKRFAQDKALHMAAAMSKPKTNQAAIQVDDWTETQQKALEQGLKKFSPNGGGDRWTLIATLVGNKTKEQCMARFRYLKERMTKK
jgi:DnaJ family protein C protein 2